jgi:hypothetical protein
VLTWAEGFAYTRVFQLALAVPAVGMIMPTQFGASRLKNLLTNKMRTLRKVVGVDRVGWYEPKSLAAFSDD